MFGVSKALWGAFVLLALLFVFVPQIDIAFTSLFYNDLEGFYLSENPVVQFCYHYGPKIVVLAAIVGLIVLLLDFAFKKHLLNIKPLVLLYLTLVMIIGPGIIVHSIFKDHWGRARPQQTELFGGTQQFTAAFMLSDQCDKNCSFVSGHSASAFALIALAFVVRRRKRLVFTLGASYGVLVGFGRIAQGGHFLSDVLFSFVFVYLSARILYHFLFEKKIIPYKFLTENPNE